MKKTALLLFLLIPLLSRFPSASGLYGSFSFDDFIIDEETTHTGISFYDALYPVAINTASPEELSLIAGLSLYDIRRIVDYRQNHPIRTEDDLRIIGLSEALISRIISYITFENEDNLNGGQYGLLSPFHLFTFPRLINRGLLSLRQRIRYQQRAYKDDDTASVVFQQTEIEYNNIRIGYVSTGEEQFLSDNYSYYLFYNSGKILNRLVLGKYRLTLGQGISYAPAFGFSKNASTVTAPVKSRTVLSPHTSPYNSRSLEGIAGTVRIGNISATPFLSMTKLHARLQEGRIRTIYSFGEHREEHKNNVTEQIAGASVMYRYENNVYGGYLSAIRFDKEFAQPERSSRYQSNGLFFTHHLDKLTLLGEYARIDGKTGILAGAGWGEGMFRQLLLYRNYEKGMPVWHGNPFSAASSHDNEQGVYYGLELRAIPKTLINVYFDVWKYPGTSYFEKMPVTRSEQFGQIIYSFTDNRLRLRIRNKDYEKYRVINEERKIRSEQSLTCTFDWTYNIGKDISIRSGIQFTDRYIPEAKDYRKGFLFYEYIRWRKGIFDIMAQINVYDSETGHYIYEHTLHGMWESRPLNGDDIYVWLLKTLNITNQVRLQVKAARFYSGKQTNFFAQIIHQW